MISFKHIKLLLLLGLTPLAASASISVGTPKAAADVNSNGAAVYNMSVEIPDGGGFHPQIGLAYNSQSDGYGNAGYGFNITGISVITSGGKDIYHDGEVKGKKYRANSSYYLDGKRLVLESGTEGYDGATYTIEGDPYTKVTVHGHFSTRGVSVWFEVLTPDGTSYNYGETASSRLTFTRGSKARCAAWYISSAIDKYKNTITYDYTKVNMVVLPTSITYGDNQIKSRGIKCQIDFTYDTIPEANRTDFYLMDKTGVVSKKLETITSSITSSGETKIYRKYTLGYDDNIDKSSKKYTRLTSIVEYDEWGNQYNPVTIDWNALQAMSMSRRVDNVIPASFSSTLYDEKNRSFFAVDINGDGISDILQQSYMAGKVKGTVSDNRLYVYDSQMDKNGNVTFNSSATSYYSLGDISSFGAYEVQHNGTTVADIDGDGFNDIVAQYYENSGDEKYYITFQVAFGRSIEDKGIIHPQTYRCPSELKDPTSQLSVNMDINGDGRDEMVFIEYKDVPPPYKVCISYTNISLWSFMCQQRQEER